jgi:hypothetical protein
MEPSDNFGIESSRNHHQEVFAVCPAQIEAQHDSLVDGAPDVRWVRRLFQIATEQALGAHGDGQ